jgi:hypothetical protein
MNRVEYHKTVTARGVTMPFSEADGNISATVGSIRTTHNGRRSYFILPSCENAIQSTTITIF